MVRPQKTTAWQQGHTTMRPLKTTTMNYKQQDRAHILSYLQKYNVATVDAIIQESGAEKLRVYPILFELNQEGIIHIVEETKLGAPVKIELT